MCDPVIVMAEGSVLFEGTPDEVKKNEKVIESYLGRGNTKLGDKNWWLFLRVIKWQQGMTMDQTL